MGGGSGSDSDQEISLASLNVPTYRRDVWLLCSAAALYAAAFLGLRQLLLALYTLRLGYGPEFVGSIFAVGALSFAAGSLVGGTLGTRIGPRRILILGGVITVLGMALLPMTEDVPIDFRTAWIFLSQGVCSLGYAFIGVNAIATLAAYTEPAGRRGAFAIREAFAGSGSFLGALLGGLLPGLFAGMMGLTTANPTPYRHALWGAVVIGLIGLVPLVMTTRVARPVRSSIRAPRFRVTPALGLLVLAGYFNNAAHAASKSFATAYLDRFFALPPALTGAITSAGMLVAVALALSGPRLFRGFKSGRTMMVASLGISAALFLMAAVPHWAVAAFGMMGVDGILAIWRPAYQSQQMEIAPPEWRSLVSGAASMGMSLGFGSLSLTGGFLVVSLGYRRVFLLGAVVAIASALFVSLLVSHLGARSQPEREPAPIRSTP